MKTLIDGDGVSAGRGFGIALALLLAACGSKSTPSGTPAGPATPSPETTAEPETDEAKPAPVERETADEEEPDRHYGKFVRFELITAKSAEAAAFYGKWLGWTATPARDGGGELLLRNGEREVGRIRALVKGGPVPAGWMSWISVEDVDDMLLDVPANGGTVLAPASDGDWGRGAVAKGPTGGVFGLIQLSGSADDGGSPRPGDLVLSQLWTSDFETALGFYSVVGDYNSIEVTHGKTKYQIMVGEGSPRALIRLAPSRQANRWIPFVLSTDVDAGSKKAKSLGAKVITEPRDVPTLGRIAVVQAPTGGIIGLIAPAAGDGDDEDEDEDEDD